jgi:hypothetical protein
MIQRNPWAFHHVGVENDNNCIYQRNALQVKMARQMVSTMDPFGYEDLRLIISNDIVLTSIYWPWRDSMNFGLCADPVNLVHDFWSNVSQGEFHVVIKAGRAYAPVINHRPHSFTLPLPGHESTSVIIQNTSEFSDILIPDVLYVRNVHITYTQNAASKPHSSQVMYFEIENWDDISDLPIALYGKCVRILYCNTMGDNKKALIYCEDGVKRSSVLFLSLLILQYLQHNRFNNLFSVFEFNSLLNVLGCLRKKFVFSYEQFMFALCGALFAYSLPVEHE